MVKYYTRQNRLFFLGQAIVFTDIIIHKKGSFLA
jgi:hypothetical protein